MRPLAIWKSRVALKVCRVNRSVWNGVLVTCADQHGLSDDSLSQIVPRVEEVLRRK